MSSQFELHLRSVQSNGLNRTASCELIINSNKKFELMLTKSMKAYSSFCSQTVSLSLAISLQFILAVCTAAEDCKNW